MSNFKTQNNFSIIERNYYCLIFKINKVRKFIGTILSQVENMKQSAFQLLDILLHIKNILYEIWGKSNI